METTKMCLLELTKADAMVLANVIRRYERMAEELSNSEREVIYFVTITTLK